MKYIIRNRYSSTVFYFIKFEIKIKWNVTFSEHISSNLINLLFYVIKLYINEWEMLNLMHY